jgi:hypothetical protein
MRKSVVVKSLLLSVLLNGAAVFSVQASNLAYEISRIGNFCDESRAQLAMAVEEQGGSPLSVGNGLNVSTAAGDAYFATTAKEQFNSLIESASRAGTSVNSSSCDGLMAQLGNSMSIVDSDTQAKLLGGTVEAVTSQPNAVPLSAAAWLFSSALFGFVMVANRRKV